MISSLRRILLPLALLAGVAALVVLLNQTLQLASLAERFHPLAGDLVFWGLLLLYAGCAAVPLYLFLRLPRSLVPPESEDSPEFEEHLRRLASRLARNPHVDAPSPRTREEIEAVLEKLDRRAQGILEASGRRVFLLTAISQNGALDALLVLGLQSKLVWDLAHVYSQRPTLRDMTWLYANVLTTAFVAGEIDEADLSAQVQPVLSSVLGSAAAAVPGLQVASSVFVNSVVTGTANAFLTLRVGIIAQEYSGALVRPRKGALRRSAMARAAGMLGGIAMAGASQVSAAIARASGRTVTGAAAGVGRRVRRAGEAVADRLRFGDKAVPPGGTPES